MTVKVTTARFTTPTSTGNQTWTDTNLGGLTPKAVMLFAGHADTDGTAEDNMAQCIGYCTGASNEVSDSAQFQTGVGTTNTDCRMDSAQFAALLVTSTTIQVAATFVSFQANSVTLNFNTVDTDEQLWTVVFFAGDDLTAHAGVIDDVGNVTDTTTDVTAPGFEPDLVFLSSAQLTGTGNNSNGRMSFGAAVNDGADTQASISWFSRNGQTASIVISYMSTVYAGTALVPTALDYGLEVDAFDSSGFSVITRNAGGNNDDWHYLALSFGNAANVNLRSIDSPTSTGNDARTGIGFEPQFVLLGLMDLQTADTALSNADAGSFGVSCFTENAEYCNSWADEDAAATTNTQTLSDDTAVHFTTQDGTQQYVASFSSMGSDGYTLNYSVADATARKWFELAIQSVSSSSIVVYRRRRDVIGAF